MINSLNPLGIQLNLVQAALESAGVIIEGLQTIVDGFDASWDPKVRQDLANVFELALQEKPGDVAKALVSIEPWLVGTSRFGIPSQMIATIPIQKSIHPDGTVSIQFSSVTEAVGGVSQTKVDWQHLDRVSRRIFEGDLKAVQEAQEIMESGLVGEMTLSLEHCADPDHFNEVEREIALQKLKELEFEFEKTKAQPDSLPFNVVYQDVLFYLESASEVGLEIKLPDQSAYNAFYNLIQLAQFLKRGSHLLDPFSKKEEQPALLSDLLLGRLGKVKARGSCVPMAMMGAHLGKRIGIHFQSYFSERHMSLLVPWLDSLVIYQPNSTLDVFLPHDHFVKLCKAPKEQRGSSLVEWVVAQVCFTQYEREDGERYLGLATQLFPNNFIVWAAYASFLVDQKRWKEAFEAANKGLALFPLSLVLLLKKARSLFELGFKMKAKFYLNLAQRVMNLQMGRHKPYPNDVEEYEELTKLFS